MTFQRIHDKLGRNPECVQSLADKWAGCACTLNGRPAKITGRLLPYGHVGLLDGVTDIEYNWYTIDRVMSAGGAFVVPGDVL